MSVDSLIHKFFQLTNEQMIEFARRLHAPGVNTQRLSMLTELTYGEFILMSFDEYNEMLFRDAPVHKELDDLRNKHLDLLNMAVPIAEQAEENAAELDELKKQYSEPNSVANWAAKYKVHRNTMRKWFKTGQVRAKPSGPGKSKLWRVLTSDLPK